jgi:protein O-mannosyl-transferase
MILSILKNNWKTILLLVLLSLSVYVMALPSEFVSDDIANYVTNPNLGSYNFNLNFVYSLNDSTIYHLFGASPIAYRSLNLLFHTVNVILAFLILSLIVKKKTVATFAAALFAVHPILAESITWISGGIYAKYSFFLLFSLLLYISAKNWKKIIISLILFIFALSFSEKALIFPGILFVYELSFRSLKTTWKKLVPYFFISLAWFSAIFFRFGERVESLDKDFYGSPSDNNPLYQIPIAITKYFELIFWPDKLTLYQTEMFFTPLSFWIRTSLTTIFVLLIIFSLLKKKKLNQYFFWLSFLIIALLPTLLPLGVAWIVAERYIYLGSLGLFAIIGILLDKINNIYKTKTIFVLLSILIIIVLGTRTIDRNRDWKNQDTLWIATANVSPSGHNIHNNLGDVYGRAGDKQRAIEEFQLAIAINPNYADAMHNLASVYLEVDQVEPAIFWYRSAIEKNPYLWQSYKNLSIIYFNLNQPDIALEILKKGLEANPENPALIEIVNFILEQESEIK